MQDTQDRISRELRTVETLIATLRPNRCFVEDLVCLEVNRKALRAALAIERAHRAAARTAAPHHGDRVNAPHSH
jgi:hypothetical protein